MADHSGITTIVTLGAVGVGVYLLYEWWMTQQPQPVKIPPAATPGTTATMAQGSQPTSVSNAPPSTTPQPSMLDTLVINMQNAIGQTTATADEWNTAFARVMGQGIDSKYNINFDGVYGAVVDGQRNNGATMDARMFIQLAAQSVSGGLPGLSGLAAAIARYPFTSLQTTGNMIYRAHHPLPYMPSYRLALSGMGATTQATGMEKALWAAGRLRRIR